MVSKTYHYIATSRKMARHQEKLRDAEKESNQINVKVKAHDEKISALKVFGLLEDEANNIEENEVAFFQNKLEAVHEQVAAIEHTLSGTNFSDEFFN